MRATGRQRGKQLLLLLLLRPASPGVSNNPYSLNSKSTTSHIRQTFLTNM